MLPYLLAWLKGVQREVGGCFHASLLAGCWYRGRLGIHLLDVTLTWQFIEDTLTKATD